MNSAQLAKYHITKKQWADARKARGAAADQAALDTLQQRTIGRACSSKDFTQRDLDAMLGAFLAEARPGDLNAQLQQIDQPARPDGWGISTRLGRSAARGRGSRMRSDNGAFSCWHPQTNDGEHVPF
jgi:hypothetical protein